jgi:hypothetical protein
MPQAFTGAGMMASFFVTDRHRGPRYSRTASEWSMKKNEFRPTNFNNAVSCLRDQNARVNLHATGASHCVLCFIMSYGSSRKMGARWWGWIFFLIITFFYLLVVAVPEWTKVDNLFVSLSMSLFIFCSRF